MLFKKMKIMKNRLINSFLFIQIENKHFKKLIYSNNKFLYIIIFKTTKTFFLNN